ncbi:MAG TPA: cupin domain-containing protein [Sphingomicrobium sp.]|nr:cupin domain-containing protein [Sphingomicrobium sp.]
MNFRKQPVPMRLLVAGALVLAGPPSFARGAEPPPARPAAKPASTATPIFERELPNVPGKSLLAVEVVYPPGGASPPHRHPASAFIYAYVVSGAIVSAVDEQKPRIYRAGESFYEAPGAHHRVSRNASTTRPAKMLAVFVKNSGNGQLVFPDAK